MQIKYCAMEPASIVRPGRPCGFRKCYWLCISIISDQSQPHNHH